MDDLVPARGDVLGRQRRAVVKLHALADLERVGEPIVGGLRHLGAQVAPEIRGRGRVARIDADQHAVERRRRVHHGIGGFAVPVEARARRRPGSCRSGRRRASASPPMAAVAPKATTAASTDFKPRRDDRARTPQARQPEPSASRLPSCSQVIVSSSCEMQLFGCLCVRLLCEAWLRYLSSCDDRGCRTAAASGRQRGQEQRRKQAARPSRARACSSADRRRGADGARAPGRAGLGQSSWRLPSIARGDASV